MSKRVSGPPRRPRNPVAKQVRTPRFSMRVEADRKRQPVTPTRRQIDEQLDAGPDADTNAAHEETDSESDPPDEAGV